MSKLDETKAETPLDDADNLDNKEVDGDVKLIKPEINETQNVDDKSNSENHDVTSVTVSESPQIDLNPPKKPNFIKRFCRPELILPRFLRNKLGKHARLVGVCIILAILAIIGAGVFWWFNSHNQHQSNSKQPVERFQAVVPEFQVVKTTPGRDQKNVDVASKITVLFNRPVDASKVDGDFFVTPKVDGTFSQGANPEEVVFTPKVPFDQGTIVEVMLHGELQSDDGSQLGADYFFGFTTAIPGNGVFFQDQNYMETVSSEPSGKPKTFTVVVGDEISSNAEVTTYKSDMDTLLRSLTYDDKTSDGYTYQDFIYPAVGTAGLKMIGSKKAIKANDTIDVPGDTGVYLVVATDNGKQVGHVWAVFSDFGVLLRQDDQKVILTAQNFSDGADVNADVTFYNLNKSVNKLRQATINGLTNLALPYSPQLDVAVAKVGNSQAIVPVSELTSLADLRSTQDLSAKKTIFGLTDKPTYKTSEKVQYAGFARTDNDANYALPKDKKLNLYIADSNYNDHLQDFSTTLNADGSFNGSFLAAANLIESDQTKRTLHIYASSDFGQQYDADVASFSVTSDGPADSIIKVSFDKKEYLSSDTVTAKVSATDVNGAPLANTTIDVDTYAKDYYEGDPSSNLAAFDSLGTKLNDDATPLKLDANGEGEFTVDISKIPAGQSNVVTVQASHKGTNGLTAAGGSSAIIHQGDGAIEFGASRTVVSSGGDLLARVYVKKLDGSAISNAPVDYKLIARHYNDSTGAAEDSEVSSGSVDANSDGYAEIHTKAKAKTDDSLEMVVWTGDSSNNKIQASSYYYVTDSSSTNVFSELQLSGLDVSGSVKDVKVGDTMNLTINSPTAVRAIITKERGRIHSSEVLDLKPGNNSYQIKVTPELAPSFTLVFSYFKNGQYQTDGILFNVSDSTKQASLELTADKPSYVTGDTATVSISAKDSSANPLSTNIIVGVVDANMFLLNDQVIPDIYTYLYSPREITTNSSSSLLGLGSGGGGCGGGGGFQPDFATAVGSVLLWQPKLKTDASGMVSTTVKLPKGSWRVYAYSASDGTIVGGSTTTIVAK